MDNNFGEGGGGSMDQLVVLKHYQKNSQVKKWNSISQVFELMIYSDLKLDSNLKRFVFLSSKIEDLKTIIIFFMMVNGR